MCLDYYTTDKSASAERLLLCKCVNVAKGNLHVAYTMQSDSRTATKADCEDVNQQFGPRLWAHITGP